MPRVTSAPTSRPGRPGTAPARPRPGLPTPYAEAVLDLVERIPPGRAMAYGDVAAALQRGGGPRQVGTVMARFGSGVPWHRVVRADGSPAPGHEAEALRRHRREGTPLTASGTRLDMAAAAPVDPRARLTAPTDDEGSLRSGSARRDPSHHRRPRRGGCGAAPVWVARGGIGA